MEQQAQGERQNDEHEIIGSPPGGLPGEIFMPITSNTAYEAMEQQGQVERLNGEHEIIGSPPGGPPEEIFIPITSNTAYEAIEGGDLGYDDVIIRPPSGPPPIVDEIYDNLSPVSPPIYSYIPVDPPSTVIPHASPTSSNVGVAEEYSMGTVSR